jgi:hypothetical protein
MSSAAAASSTTQSPAVQKHCLADSLPENERIRLIPAVDAAVDIPIANPEEKVLVWTADKKSKILIDRAALIRFCSSYRLMMETGNHSVESEWKLADAITATAQNLSYFASWVNYYGGKPDKKKVDPSSTLKIPTCITYPIFLGPTDYVLEAADYLFIENDILEGKGLAGQATTTTTGKKPIMKLISLGEFAAAIDCGMLRDLVSGYIAARIREADEEYVEGVGPSADVVVRSWFGLEGGLSDAEFAEAKKKFGGDAEKGQKNMLSGRDWQEHDRRARAAQKAAGVLPLQPYE